MNRIIPLSPSRLVFRNTTHKCVVCLVLSSYGYDLSCFVGDRVHVHLQPRIFRFRRANDNNGGGAADPSPLLNISEHGSTTNGKRQYRFNYSTNKAIQGNTSDIQQPREVIRAHAPYPGSNSGFEQQTCAPSKSVCASILERWEASNTPPSDTRSILRGRQHRTRIQYRIQALPRHIGCARTQFRIEGSRKRFLETRRRNTGTFRGETTTTAVVALPLCRGDIHAVQDRRRHGSNRAPQSTAPLLGSEADAATHNELGLDGPRSVRSERSQTGMDNRDRRGRRHGLAEDECESHRNEGSGDRSR